MVLTEQAAAPLLSDETVTCVRCLRPFLWTTAEQAFYARHILARPRRCRPCRQAALPPRASRGAETRACRSCGQPFEINVQTREWYEEHGLSLPWRCSPCRRRARA
jgi:hypothetical protein